MRCKINLFRKKSFLFLGLVLFLISFVLACSPSCSEDGLNRCSADNSSVETCTDQGEGLCWYLEIVCPSYMGGSYPEASCKSCDVNPSNVGCELDGDGYWAGINNPPCSIDGDCNDTNAIINPGMPEICTDGVDNDCDNSTGSLDADLNTGIDCNDLDCNASNFVCSTCTGLSTFTYNSSSDVCRAAGGVCDGSETCTGSSSTCPTDVFNSSATVCRSAAGTCDVNETCTGSTADCPADAKSSAECRASAGDCDVAESCDGSSDDCPADAFSSAVCRASAGLCDLIETCDGASVDCPVDAFAAADTSCRASAGDCDTAEVCAGATADCPSDSKSVAVCRVATGECDVAETCDGASDDCPVDAYQSTSTSCTYSSCASTCDGAGSCTSASCSCFPAGTKVLMADGSKKNIEKVKVGEIVLSYDVELMKFAKSKVLELESPIREGYYIIEFEDGTELKITNEHPVWVRG